MKNRRMILGIFWIVLGAALLGCNLAGLLDDYWGGMGGGLIGAGALQTVRNYRYLHCREYREKTDRENRDERNRFIANKAWAWVGYLYVLIAALSTVVFQLLGRQILSRAAGLSVCLILTLYWVSYLILQKKY